MEDQRVPFRGMVSGLSAMGRVVLRGEEYSGEYLATLVSINPEQPESEAARTPEVIAQLGRLTAAAFREKELRELDYRVWREKQVYLYCNDLEAAVNAGFESAANPGKDAKGHDKPAKCPTTGDVETYVRTLPEYAQHYRTKLDAEEAWSTLHSAYTAAQARTTAIRAFERSGGVAHPDDRRPTSEPSRENSRPESRYYDDGGGEALKDQPVGDVEAQAAQVARTPIPPRPSVASGPPPQR